MCIRDRFYDISYDSGQILPESFHQIVEFSILASQIDPFDPMEKAFKTLGEHFLAATEHLHADWILQKEYPLSEKLLALSRVWRSPNGRDYVIAAKGHQKQSLICAISLQDTRPRLNGTFRRSP